MNIPVHCSHVRMAKVADLKPNPRNPNRHPPEQIARAIMREEWHATGASYATFTRATMRRELFRRLEGR